jgi:hypothetical protein
MHARLLTSNGFWALQWDGDSRPVLTSFPASADWTKVLKALRREYRDVEIEEPAGPGWLFEVEELRPYEMEPGGLFT